MRTRTARTAALAALAITIAGTDAYVARGAGKKVTHRVLVSGCGLGMLAIVDHDGSTIWSVREREEADDAWMLPDGHIIYAFKSGVREIIPDLESGTGARTVWERRTPEGGETHSCQPIGDGLFLIGESFDGVSYLVEIARGGAERKRIELRGLGGKHSTFRNVRKTPQGTYLITQQRGGGKAHEFDASGKKLRVFPDGRFVAIRLGDGNTLIACGDAHRVIEVDPEGNIVWEIGRDDVPGLRLGFAAGLERLPNGNTLICNWGGHGGSEGAAVVEVTREKKLVWSLTKSVKNRVASVQLLDKLPPKSSVR